MMLFLSVFSPLLPLVAGWRKRFTCLWNYAFTAFLADLAVYLFKHVLHLGFYWLCNIFLLGEFLFLTCYFQNSIFKRSALLRFAGISGGAAFLLHTTLSLHWLRFNYLASSILYFYYIVLAIAGFYQLLKEKKMMFLEQSGFFWANVAILIYASGNFFIFLLRNNVQSTDPAMMMLLWSSVFLSLNIMKNILLSIALSKKMKA